MSCDFIWTEVLESVNYLKVLPLKEISPSDAYLFIERPNIFKYFQKSRKLKEV